ncbi:MAG: HD domain-containing protein [Candidatus Sericytochromatia bacterium]|uniref:HD domain-containing protein n=1 Tax=Candidatus Tanganyikabacteria bacterium TaxID=2961651 RepID=A0A937X0U0_9BACT|nr:HD domain-containing protein [Candidatus Tanganyikabacteria bacterium]
MAGGKKATPLKKKKAAGAAPAQEARREDPSYATRREVKEAFGRILDEWRELGKLDVGALRRLVEEFVLLVPADSKQPPPDLRVSGEYALAHPINMLGHCLQVGKQMGIGGQDLRHLGMAALVHDFGKEIPETHPEREELKRLDEHCATGYKLLTELAPDFPRPAAEAVRDHHERIDGRGVLKKTKFSELAAIVGLCDVYDARVTHHPFRGATSPHVAFTLTLNVASLFPKQVADAFCAAIVPYPLGAPVFLVDGRKGEVVEINPENATTPIVLVDGEREDLRDNPKSRVADLIRSALPL